MTFIKESESKLNFNVIPKIFSRDIFDGQENLTIALGHVYFILHVYVYIFTILRDINSHQYFLTDLHRLLIGLYSI